MTASTLERTGTKAADLPAAAGGDPAVQLRHLRAHREFQRQDRWEQMRLDWCTVITREQSGRHTLRHLHMKINAKAGLPSSGRTDTPEGQEDLRRFARTIRNRERVEHSGHGHRLRWKLRYRMVRSSYPRLTEAQFLDLMENDHPGAIVPKQQGFPAWVRQRIAIRERRDQLLRLQGLSPRRHRDAVVVRVYRCSGCRNFVREDAAPEQRCPVCRNSLQPWELAEVACRPGPDPQPVSTEGFGRIRDGWNGPLGQASRLKEQR